MGQGRFLNQKLGKRTNRKVRLTKVKLAAQGPYGKQLRPKGPGARREKMPLK